MNESEFCQHPNYATNGQIFRRTLFKLTPKAITLIPSKETEAKTISTK